MPLKTDDPTKLDNQLCFPLYAAARAITNAYRPYLDKLDLTYTQYIAMMVLWEHKQVKVTTLGQLLHLDTGTLSPLIKKLVSKGLCVKERNPNDERVVLVSITNEGLELKNKLSFMHEGLGKCVKGFDKKQLDTLYDLLYQFIDMIECATNHKNKD